MLEGKSASELDALIREAARLRAGLAPPVPASPPEDAALRHHADNMLWSVRPAPDGGAVEWSLYHPGLGWTTIRLSRAQIQDLQDALAFAIHDLPLRTKETP